MNESADSQRRKFMTMTGLAGGMVATVGGMVPFAVYLEPSRRTKGEGAPIKVDLTGLEVGRLHVVAWRRKPVWVLKRTPAMIDSLAKDLNLLSDPESARSDQPSNCTNETRSIKPDLFVVIGVCTHLGCSPGSAPPDGFLCSCHGSRFDYAGRVYAGSPAPSNLAIPEYYFTTDNSVVIGTSIVV